MQILNSTVRAFQLVFFGNARVLEITLRALFVSGTSALIAVMWGLPLAMFLGLRSFRGKILVKGLFNTLLGIPTVALGLILYLVFSTTGPLGILSLIYTPTAIIIGQAILITPIIVGLATTALEAVDPEIMSLAKTLGASGSQASFTVLKEALNGIIFAGIASFNRAIAELGVAQLVGGGIAGWTEVLTTAIALETARGNLELSISLAMILLTLVFGITLALNVLQRRRR